MVSFIAWLYSFQYTNCLIWTNTSKNVLTECFGILYDRVQMCFMYKFDWLALCVTALCRWWNRHCIIPSHSFGHSHKFLSFSMTSFTTYPRKYMCPNYFTKWTYVKNHKTLETCNFMTKYNCIRCFWAVGIRYVLILLIFVWKNRNWYWKSLLSLRNLNLLHQLRLVLDPRGLTSLLCVPMTDYVPLSVLSRNVQ